MRPPAPNTPTRIIGMAEPYARSRRRGPAVLRAARRPRAPGEGRRPGGDRPSSNGPTTDSTLGRGEDPRQDGVDVVEGDGPQALEVLVDRDDHLAPHEAPAEAGHAAAGVLEPEQRGPSR